VRQERILRVRAFLCYPIGSRGYNPRMLRRFAIIALAVIAISMAVAGTIGYVIPVCFELPMTSNDRLVLQFFDGRVRLFWFHSDKHSFRVEQRKQFRRVLLVPTPDPNREGDPAERTWVERLTRSPNLHAVPLEPLPAALPVDIAGPRPPQVAWDAMVRIGNVRTVPDFGYGWQGSVYTQNQRADFRTNRPRWLGPIPIPPARVTASYVRLPVWLPTGLLLIIPIGTALRATRHRRRRRKNECVNCGYSLTGLPSPRCPECGTPFSNSKSSQRAPQTIP